ncbi:TfuA-like protein [Enterobacter ludwigii]|uniref:TfuA-like protein n=1 Tax=Enterobacter ludwigii TaxID=299767 RepID=UPI0039751837
MNNECYVFLGPSLSRSEATEILDAIYLPPAKQSDILSLVRNQQPKSIILIDGEFGQSLSVWHKEILYALDAGVDVYGSSSMGALRASELYKFGMHGLGEIFEKYKNGIILGDDEVALNYSPPELGYHPITIPMVNVRATLDYAESSGLISKEENNNFSSIIHDIHFQDRDLKNILIKIRNHGLRFDIINKIFNDSYIDQKKIDAQLILNHCKIKNKPTKNCNQKFKFEESYTFDVLKSQDCKNNKGVGYRELSKYIFLHDRDPEYLTNNSLNRDLTILLSNMLGICTNDSEVEVEVLRFKKKFNLTSDVIFKEWLDENDVEQMDFIELMKGNAKIRKLHFWFTTRQAAKELTSSVLNYLRLNNKYSTWNSKIANCKAINNELPFEGDLQSQDNLDAELSNLLSYHLNRNGVLFTTTLDKWMSEFCFQGRTDLLHELKKSTNACKAIDALALDFISKLASKNMLR